MNERERAPGTWQSQSAHSFEHTPPKEVRVSELSNQQRVRQAVAPEPRLEREWLTYAEAGEIVGLSRVTLWKLVSSGEVKAAKVGRAVRLSRQSLTAYMRRSANSFAGNEHE
jgi:excisionase family DNA binding protein